MEDIAYFLFSNCDMGRKSNGMLCSYIQSHRLLGPGLLHLVVHDGVVDAQPTKYHKRLRKEQKADRVNSFPYAHRLLYIYQMIQKQE